MPVWAMTVPQAAPQHGVHRAEPEVPTRTGAIPVARREAPVKVAEDHSLEVPRIFDEDESSDDLDIPDFLK